MDQAIRTNRSYWLIFAAAISLLVLMPSSDSLWIDEGYTAYLAAQPSFRALTHEFVVGARSEHQMPLSMASAWAAAKVIGTSEYALRAVNLVWGLLALVAMFLIGRRLRLPWLVLLLALHPFFWAYMNEARPYAMQIASGAWLCLALIIFLQDNGGGSNWAAVLAIASVVLCGTSLLGVVLVAAVSTTIGALILREKLRPTRRAWVWLGAGVLLLTPLGAFYVWTLAKGASGSRYWEVSSANVGFTFYEWGGFAGLGPPRHLLREAAASGESYRALSAQHLPALTALTACYSAALVCFWRREKSRQELRLLAGCLCALMLSALLMTVLAGGVNWPFWGRHVSAVLPFVVLIVALLLGNSAQGRLRRIQATLLVALLGLYAVSSYHLRFDSWYRRDDYRGATTLAKTALRGGRTVWWAGNGMTARYYQLPLNGPGDRGGALLVQNRTATELQELAKAAPPDLIALTKPSALDVHHALRDFVAGGDWELVSTPQAFLIYSRRDTGNRR